MHPLPPLTGARGKGGLAPLISENGGLPPLIERGQGVWAGGAERKKRKGWEREREEGREGARSAWGGVRGRGTGGEGEREAKPAAAKPATEAKPEPVAAKPKPAKPETKADETKPAKPKTKPSGSKRTVPRRVRKTQ